MPEPVNPAALEKATAFLKDNAKLVPEGAATIDANGLPATGGTFRIEMRRGRMFAGIKERMVATFRDAFPGCDFTFDA